VLLSPRAARPEGCGMFGSFAGVGPSAAGVLAGEWGLVSLGQAAMADEGLSQCGGFCPV